MVIPSSIRKLEMKVMDVGRERALKNRQVRPDTIRPPYLELELHL